MKDQVINFNKSDLAYSISKKLNIKLIDLNEYLLDNKNNIGQYYPFGGPEGHFSEYENLVYLNKLSPIKFTMV